MCSRTRVLVLVVEVVAMVVSVPTRLCVGETKSEDWRGC